MDKPLLIIPEFGGVNTNAPMGTKMQPTLLENVNLDRTGGYSAMWERVLWAENVTHAVPTGYGRGLFVSGPSGTLYDPVDSAGNIIWDGSVKDAVPLMPGLIAVGETLLTPGGPVKDTTPPTITYAYVEKEDGWPKEDELEWLAEFEQGGTQTWKTGGANGTPPAKYHLKLSATSKAKANLYVRNLTQKTGYTYQITMSGTTLEFGPTTPTDAAISPPVKIVGRAAAYHQSRVYRTGAGEWQEIGSNGPVTRQDPSTNRLWYSNTIASIDGGLPHFSSASFVDVPFRVSTRIEALASVGPYLYIFGDRELWIMTGDPDADARLECIGDSIGTVSPRSVQQLSGVVYWLSDSGLLRVQGVQVQEVGEPVRDQLDAMGTVTTTVDFKREQYIITDGATILVYHARENGWTTRRKEGEGAPALLYGGGTPYMLQSGSLYSIGGEKGKTTPTRLTMRVRYPYFELGDWRARKAFTGLAFGLDLATTSAEVKNRTTVDARLDQTTDTTQTVRAGTAGPVRLHTASDGVNMSGCAISVELEITTQDTRGIMRPPLQVYGFLNGEEAWTDER